MVSLACYNLHVQYTIITLTYKATQDSKTRLLYSIYNTYCVNYRGVSILSHLCTYTVCVRTLIVSIIQVYGTSQ